MRQALGNWYQQHDREAPGSLQEAGLPDTLPDGSRLGFDPMEMVLTVETRHGELLFVPENLEDTPLVWRCFGGRKVGKAALLPRACSPRWWRRRADCTQGCFATCSTWRRLARAA